MTTLYGGVDNTPDGSRPLLNVQERMGDETEMYRRMLDACAEQIRAATPAQVVSFDPATQTIVAQPLIRERVIDRATGATSWVTLPQIQDVPVQFPGAGDWDISFTPKPGDECLLHFADSCIDSWHTSSGIQSWNMKRRHALSDACAIMGIRSKPNVVPPVVTDGIELRKRDGSGFVRLESASLVGDADAGSFLPAELGFTKTTMSGGGASVVASKTIKVDIIGGIPVPTIRTTLDFNATRFRFNGVDFSPV